MGSSLNQNTWRQKNGKSVWWFKMYPQGKTTLRHWRSEKHYVQTLYQNLDTRRRKNATKNMQKCVIVQNLPTIKDTFETLTKWKAVYTKLLPKQKHKEKKKNHSIFSKVCDGANSLPKPKRKKKNAHKKFCKRVWWSKIKPQRRITPRH